MNLAWNQRRRASKLGAIKGLERFDAFFWSMVRLEVARAKWRIDGDDYNDRVEQQDLCTR